MGEILEHAVLNLDERLRPIVTSLVRGRPIELIGVLQEVGLFVKIKAICLPVRDQALAELRVLEGGALDIDSSAAVLAHPRHEPLRDVIRIVHGHFHVVVRLDLDQCLLVVEILEVAVVEVESGRMSPIAMHRVKGIQVEQNLVPLAVMLDHWEERNFFIFEVFNDYENCV